MFLLYLPTHWPLFVGTSLWRANVAHNAWIKREGRSESAAVFLVEPRCARNADYIFVFGMIRAQSLPARYDSKLHRFTVRTGALSADAFCPTFRFPLCARCCNRFPRKDMPRLNVNRCSPRSDRELIDASFIASSFRVKLRGESGHGIDLKKKLNWC